MFLCDGSLEYTSQAVTCQHCYYVGNNQNDKCLPNLLESFGLQVHTLKRILRQVSGIQFGLKLIDINIRRMFITTELVFIGSRGDRSM